VLVPARRDGGTNILALSRPDLIAPQFGPASFARHLCAAKDLGIEATILELAGAGHDIDVPADLEFAAPSGAGAQTRAALGGVALSRRSQEVPFE
jgi:2-phospho-L-lactate guanylyltransferase (CobY/MobA/RfbA family)